MSYGDKKVLDRPTKQRLNLQVFNTMRESKKIIAFRKLMELQGDKPEQIEATLKLFRVNEENENIDTLRSWIAVIISGIALMVSILVAIYK